jgi:hypothetical protein
VRGAITAPRECIVWNLEAYGEDEVAKALSKAPDEVLFQTWLDASAVMIKDTERRMIDHYLARGAVKTITGHDRPLARKVRRFTRPEPRSRISSDQEAAWQRWWKAKRLEAGHPT